VDTEVLNLVQRDRLILRRTFFRWFVALNIKCHFNLTVAFKMTNGHPTHLWIRSKSPQIHFPSGDGANGINLKCSEIQSSFAFQSNTLRSTYNNRNEGLLELLIEHLRAHVNARQPTTIAWMTVVPSDALLEPTHLQTIIEINCVFIYNVHVVVNP